MVAPAVPNRSLLGDAEYMASVVRQRRERAERAGRVCDTCPVRQECARMALETREQYGVWGGLSEADRVRML